MRTSITVAAIAAIASTAAAYEYEEDIFAREAEPILGLNHMGKWIGEAVGSVCSSRWRGQCSGQLQDQTIRRNGSPICGCNASRHGVWAS